MTTHPQKTLAEMARNHPTKKELATKLKGPALDEAWRIKQLQTERQKRNDRTEIDASPRSSWDCRALKFEARASAMIWPFAYYYRRSFCQKIADRIQSKWPYTYRWHKYVVSVDHSREVEMDTSHAGSGCVDYPFRISFDLLRQEAVWIGGMLTIRAKSDAGKTAYPCCWFEKIESSPRLLLRHGRIVRRNYHQEDPHRRELRLAPARLKRAVKKVSETKAAKGWVTEKMSLQAGNCPSGTRNWIQSKLVPWFQNHRFVVGDLTGAAIQRSLMLEVERSAFTKRL